jgi:hypothetical protein
MKIDRAKKIALACSDDKATRENLAHPYHKDGKLYATDGKIAVSVTVDEEKELNGYVPVEAVKEASKKPKRGEPEPVINIGENEVQVIASNTTVFKRPDEKTMRNFPVDQIEEMLERHNSNPVLRIGIDPALLKRLAEAMGAEQVVLSIPCNCADEKGIAAGAIGVRPIDQENDSAGVIMPYRIK